MSYKDQRKELGLAPAGSAAPMTTQDGSKWHHGVDGAGIAKLTKLATEINKVMDETATTVAKAQIKVGRLLNEARALIPGDLQFGQWREKNTPITNKSTANKLMNLAKQIGEGRITQELLDALPMSTLKELISAPDSVVASTIRMVVEEEKTPTREEVREMAKEAKEPIEGEHLPAEPKQKSNNTTGSQASHSAPGAPQKPTAPAAGQVMSSRAMIDLIIQKSLIERVRHLDPKGAAPYTNCKPLEWAFLVLGLDPDPASYPNPQVIEILEAAYKSELDAFTKDSEELVTILERAVKMINEAA